MWSGQWPGPGPAGSGLGLKYEIVLRAGPGLDIIVAGRAGPGPQNSICGPGPGQVCATAAGPGRAWTSNHVCGPGLGQDFRPVQGPSVRDTIQLLVEVLYDHHVWSCHLSDVVRSLLSANESSGFMTTLHYVRCSATIAYINQHDTT